MTAVSSAVADDVAVLADGSVALADGSVALADDLPTLSAVVSPVSVRARRKPSRVFADRRSRRWLLLALAVLLVVSALSSVRIADVASGYDFAGLVNAVAYDAVHLRWQFATLVAVLAAAHYVASAVAARAAAGLRAPLAETVMVQLAASAANRVTPAGLGGAAITVRYFGKRGMATTSAIGVVIALNVLRGAADLILMSLLVLLGGWVGLGGGADEVRRLSAKLSAATDPLQTIPPRAIVALAVVAALAAAVLLARRRVAGRVIRGCARFWSPIKELLRRPAAVLTVLSASAATTLMLALAFALSVHMVPGADPHASVGPLVIGFMLASAASNAVPTPAGIGATETALVSVLLASAIPIAHAVEVVVVYRLITFWLPPLIGLLVTGRLRRSGAL